MAGSLDLTIVRPDPATRRAADVPGGIVPEEHQNPDAISRELLGGKSEKGAGDGTDRPPLDETEQHPCAGRQPEAVAGQCLRLGVVTLGGTQGEAEWSARFRPGMHGWLRQAREPDLVGEAERPAWPAPCPSDQVVTPLFLCA